MSRSPTNGRTSIKREKRRTIKTKKIMGKPKRKGKSPKVSGEAVITKRRFIGERGKKSQE